MDPLAPILSQFTLSAKVFYAGRLCGLSGDHTESTGHLHLLREGELIIIGADSGSVTINRPAVLFYPRPIRHQFKVEEATGAQLVCARIDFGQGIHNLLVQSLPELLIVPLESVKELESATELLFGEAFGDNPGRQTAVDRLAEYFLLLVLRTVMKKGLIQGGVLMGLADPRLANAMTAIHKDPAHEWTLEELAQKAAMSRTRFAGLFRKVVGITPFEYLTDWRIGIAQTLLRRGQAMKIVAPMVGYGSSAALARVFSQRLGVTPKQWLMQVRELSRHE